MSAGGGMVAFRIKGGYRAASKFLETLKVFTLGESLGGVESLAEHPARMTHASLPPEERRNLGITDDLIRLSVGVEDTTTWSTTSRARSGPRCLGLPDPAPA